MRWNRRITGVAILVISNAIYVFDVVWVIPSRIEISQLPIMVAAVSLLITGTVLFVIGEKQ